MDDDPLSTESLREAAFAYLGRRDATGVHLGRVLARRIYRAGVKEPDEVEAARTRIDAVVARLVEVGIVDDARYARGRARGLLAQGRSTRVIRQKLREKGVAHEFIDTALEEVQEELGTDLAAHAVVRAARKKRVGPWARAPRDRQKELAKLARAGFSFDLARRVVDAEDEEALVAWAEGREG